MSVNIKESIQTISRGTVEIINLEGLEKKLLASQQNKQPLRVKAGFDPTAPDIHLGHVVLLHKLRQIQDLGHKIYFLIGDFTAQIGDPTGRDQTRPKLDQKKIEENAKTYKNQVFKVLDPDKTEVIFNSAWLGKLSAQEVLGLTTHSTVAQMLARADFRERFEDKKEITILEFMYPLLQAYDSVHLKADIELGGQDQKFNLLMGRQLQSAHGQEAQVVIMTPLLEGTDGVNKMSKSLNNYIGINESPDEIFGKVMSISDPLMMRYYELLTNENLNAIKVMHPKEAKLNLAETIVKRFHGEPAAIKARENFQKTFSQKQNPDEMMVYEYPSGKNILLVDVLVELKLVESKNEARRLFKQKAISHDGNVIEQEGWVLHPGVVKVGKRRFLKLAAK